MDYHTGVKIAAFISNKWFKAKRDELSMILKKPLREDPRYWSFVLQNEVAPWFRSFPRDFEKIVSFDPALLYVEECTKSALEYIDTLGVRLSRAGAQPENVNFKDTVDTFTWYALLSLHDRMKELTPTIGDVFKYNYIIDRDTLRTLVEKLVKKTPPDGLPSLKGSGLDKPALKALKREKLEWNPLDWLRRLQEGLLSKYSQQAINEQEAFREFMLDGMKIVIDDATVDNHEIKAYVSAIKQAHASLRAKKLDAAWYGTLFIQCKDCGGDPSVGGYYIPSGDTISIFQRPSFWTPYIILHEVGHRYWYKRMTSTGRETFRHLVKTHTGDKPWKSPPVTLIKDRVTRPLYKKLDTLGRDVKDLLQRLRSSDPTASRDALERHFRDLAMEIIDTGALDTTKLGAKTQELKNAVHKAHSLFRRHLEDLSDTMTKEELVLWVDRASEITETFLAAARTFLDKAIEEYNAEARESLKGDPEALTWQESYAKNPNPVLPVSEYGSTNIDEAFAEVFAYYCLESDMDRDQLESFRSVLASTRTVANVLTRFRTQLHPR